ncbi:MAG: PilZ domain-containing protein [Proteobacteria bacterium]|nr:PilZ domain-containing protein [Pseudomonadota bacterium]
MPEQERRVFSRVDFNAEVFISIGDHRYKAELMDISLKGALVLFENSSIIRKGENCLFELNLDQNSLVLKIEAILMYVQEDHLGLKFNNIDLESMIHLRRLVELNVGDPDRIQKELFFLVNPESQ